MLLQSQVCLFLIPFLLENAARNNKRALLDYFKGKSNKIMIKIWRNIGSGDADV